MKRMFLTLAFIGMISVIGNAQTKKEKVPPPPPPVPVAITLAQVPPPPPLVPPLPGSKTEGQQLLQKNNVSVPPPPPVPEPTKPIQKKH